MKVLVTGATGFIGNHVVNTLLKRGYSVVASAASKERAELSSWYDHVNFIPFRIGNTPNINLWHHFEKPDYCIHLAWGGLPHYKDETHVEDQYPQHRAFLENLLTDGLGRLLVTGTCLEYGLEEGELKEDLSVRPTTPYGIGKDMLRQSLERFNSTKAFELTWVRLFYMYGEGQNPKSLLAQLQHAIDTGQSTFNMSKGEQQRDFLPVTDIAEIIVDIVGKNEGFGIVNCCKGNPTSVKELVEDFIRRKKANIQLNLGFYPYPDYEPFKFWGSRDKLNEILK